MGMCNNNRFQDKDLPDEEVIKLFHILCILLPLVFDTCHLQVAQVWILVILNLLSFLNFGWEKYFQEITIHRIEFIGVFWIFIVKVVISFVVSFQKIWIIVGFLNSFGIMIISIIIVLQKSRVIVFLDSAAIDKIIIWFRNQKTAGLIISFVDIFINNKISI